MIRGRGLNKKKTTKEQTREKWWMRGLGAGDGNSFATQKISYVEKEGEEEEK